MLFLNVGELMHEVFAQKTICTEYFIENYFYFVFERYLVFTKSAFI